MRKITSLILMAAVAQCVSAADVATGEAKQANPSARYLALLGLMHGWINQGDELQSFEKNVDFIKQSLESGREPWLKNPNHSELTDEDIKAFSKELSVVLASKTVGEATPAMANIEAISEKIHKDCNGSHFKLAVLVAASKDVKSADVAGMLWKRAEKIRAKALADIDKSNSDFEGKCEKTYDIIEAYRMGLGLYDIPKDAFFELFDSMCYLWRGDQWQNAQVNVVKAKKCIKLAESGINIMIAVDGIISAKTPNKAKTAIMALEEAVKTRMAIMVSPNGPSKPEPDQLEKAKALCLDAYAMLIEYVKGKTKMPAIATLLNTKAAEAKRKADKCRAAQ